MKKLPFTKDELVEQYKKDIDEMLDICDWKSHIDDYDVINAISTVCRNNGLIIDSEYLSKEYKAKIKSLNLTTEEYRKEYADWNTGVPKLIGFIYEILENKFAQVK
jgi:hypothetical protein